MNTRTITNIYKRLMELECGTKYVKFDLHIHTPGSSDFVVLQDEETSYRGLLDEVLDNEIRIIAITDHNTFRGFNKTIQFINSKDGAKYREILVLCGIEITCFSKHMLAVFDSNFSQESQNKFLRDIGISPELEGTEGALADIYGPVKLLEKISEYGGIAIMAHANTSKGFLYSKCRASGDPESELNFTGKSLANILNSQYLYGIQLTDSRYESRIDDLLGNDDYKSYRASSLPFLYFSDAHGIMDDGIYNASSGKPIGSQYSIAKLSHISFSALKIALTDSYVRIVRTEINDTYPTIIGIAIKSNVLKNDSNNNTFNNYSLFRFNAEMNCIIGARGTGKSTLLQILQYTISPLSGDKSIMYRFEESIAFVSYDKTIFAIYVDSWSEKYNIYPKQINTDKFSSPSKAKNIKKIFANYLTLGYKQRQLYEYSRDPQKILEIIDDFISWKYNKEFSKAYGQYNHFSYQMDKLLDIYQNPEIPDFEKTNCIRDMQKNRKQANKFNNQMIALRQRMASELNVFLKGKVKIVIGRELDQQTVKTINETFVVNVAKAAGKYKDYQVVIKEIMKRIIDFAAILDDFDFFDLLCTNQLDTLVEKYNLSNISKIHDHVKFMKDCFSPEQLLFFPQPKVVLKYNVNSGFDKEEYFRPNYELSLGQNAVALLLIVLRASQSLNDNRPLLMDQPEDDLDNNYIYNTLINEFRKSKKNRQIIISTHNANIPVAADAENVMVLDYGEGHGKLKESGSLDKPDISDAVLNILEGGEDAFNKRKFKYSLLK